ncbi:ABC transporter substrate-binding protein [Brevibacterium aurantiacum]|uniref:ABC transporter substrate-binding protein n=2 Tax=Brevibacterium aurantiacum TaxID=273384 RepID=A0A556C3V5_BREAU|nr:ABC transporter substrate-binding protein [Brevibacterium aurantiacum]
MLLSACGASEVVEESPAAAQGEGSSSYPLTVENCGSEVTFDGIPERVVSLDQNSTEILLSLGLEDRMVGTASWTDPVYASLKKANDEVPRLANEAPTYEVLLDVDPDFVTASFGRHYKSEGGVASRDRLNETGIDSYLSPTDCEGGRSINAGQARTRPLTLETLYQEIRDMAAIFDVPSRGEALVADLEERREAALDDVDLDGKKVAFWFADTRTPYIAGGYGAASLLARMSGMENVYDDVDDDWPAVGWESFVDQDPQVVVLGDLQRDRFPGDRLEDKIEFLKSDPLTNTLSAVQNECFVSLHGAEMNPAIRYVDGLEKIQAWAQASDGCAAGE